MGITCGKIAWILIYIHKNLKKEKNKRDPEIDICRYPQNLIYPQKNAQVVDKFK